MSLSANGETANTYVMIAGQIAMLVSQNYKNFCAKVTFFFERTFAKGPIANRSLVAAVSPRQSEDQAKHVLEQPPDGRCCSGDGKHFLSNRQVHTPLSSKTSTCGEQNCPIGDGSRSFLKNAELLVYANLQGLQPRRRSIINNFAKLATGCHPGKGCKTCTSSHVSLDMKLHAGCGASRHDTPCSPTFPAALT